ncbi:MAG: regulatory protein RecX [Flavobacteriales bacterium]
MTEKLYDLNLIKQKIKHYCAREDRCQSQVITKLKHYGVSQYVIDELLIELIQEKYIDEERFARSFCSGKFKIKKWGKKKIIFKLNKLNLSNACIHLGLNEINQEDYNEMLFNLADKKNKLITEKNIYKRKKKIVDYLIGRGFESELVWECVHKL